MAKSQLKGNIQYMNSFEHADSSSSNLYRGGGAVRSFSFA